MRSILALGLGLSLSTVALAAPSPCAGVKPSTDPFTGATFTEIRALLWNVKHKDGAITLQLKWGRPGALQNVLPVGWPIDIVLDDGTQLQIKTDAETPSVNQASDYGVFTQWYPIFNLTPETAKALSASQIKAMRSDTGGGEQVWDANDAFRKNIQKALVCVVSLSEPAPTP